MAETRKSIIDEAFMEAEQIDNAFKANAKEILTQTMSLEIEEMVKESLKEDWGGLKEEDDEENVDLEFDDSNVAGLSAGDDDLDFGDLDDEEGDDLDFGDLDDEDEDLDVVDLTGEDDIEKVVNVFKKMSPEDEIEVVQDGSNFDIKDKATGAEYRIELGGDSDSMYDDEDMDDEDMDLSNLNSDEDMDDEDMDDEDMDDEDMDDENMDDDGMDEGVIYEIHLSEEDEMEEDEMEEDKMKEDEMEEGRMPRTLSKAGKVGNRKSSDMSSNRQSMGMSESRTSRSTQLMTENKVLKDKVSSIVSENESLKEDYNKMVDALKQFRQKLNEVAIFNSNLTYTVRLFTEHSTTKDEKVDIIKRFDEAKTLKESKIIYKNLVKEVSKAKTPIKESIENRINETKGSGSSTQITESKVYVDPQLEKMKKLWEYDYKK